MPENVSLAPLGGAARMVRTATEMLVVTGPTAVLWAGVLDLVSWAVLNAPASTATRRGAVLAVLWEDR